MTISKSILNTRKAKKAARYAFNPYRIFSLNKSKEGSGILCKYGFSRHSAHKKLIKRDTRPAKKTVSTLVRFKAITNAIRHTLKIFVVNSTTLYARTSCKPRSRFWISMYARPNGTQVRAMINKNPFTGARAGQRENMIQAANAPPLPKIKLTTSVFPTKPGTKDRSLAT